MKRLTYCLVIALLAAIAPLRAQSLKIVRTDVDSSRKDFITATYNFGFDVYAEGVDACNGVAFELSFDQTRYVRFSQWKIGNLGSLGQAYVISTVDTAAGNGRLTVGVGTGIPLEHGGISNPKVIHLEFTVLQTAPDDADITFSFITPVATIFKDSTAQKVSLDAPAITFNIHSFVDVWPGDADNSGEVDHLDFAQIMVYLGTGPATKSMRSFKRPSPSTLWTPQRVLAWDTADATYADCDGNGDVTMSDMLIVDYNIGKMHEVKKSGIIKPGVNAEILDMPAPEGGIRSGLAVRSGRPWTAISGTLSWDGLMPEVLGFARGDAYNSQSRILLYNISHENKTADFFLGSLDNSVTYPGESTPVYVIYSGGSIASPSSVSLKAITPAGSVFTPDAALSASNVKDDRYSTFNACYSGSSLVIESGEELPAASITLYDINGRQVLEGEASILAGTATYINAAGLPAGLYYLHVASGGKTRGKAILISSY